MHLACNTHALQHATHTQTKLEKQKSSFTTKMGHKDSQTRCPSLIFCLILLLLSPSGESLQPFACDPNDMVNQKLPFCWTSLSMEERAKDLIGRLTLKEKISLLGNKAASVPRLGIKGYEWWSEGLHGVSNTGPGVRFGGAFPGATIFPQVITTASSFNSSLWEQIGRVVSDEARAMYNGGMSGLTYWSPNVNVFRDPRWGRRQETPGEDPVLAGKYAVSYVRGLQGDGDTLREDQLKVAACCKHFTAYDLEKWNDTDRFHFDAKVSKQDLEETYNVPFKDCVVEGKAASVMCSYNRVNGKPACADADLLLHTLRAQWHFNGYIVSDCDSVEVLFKYHRYTKTPEEAVAVSLKAGLDLDCGNFLGDYTEAAIRQGKLSEADVNRALMNLFVVQMRLGMFDSDPSSHPYAYLGPKDVCTPAHRQLALEAAHQGLVLLQNNGPTLPLSSTLHRKVAVIGPNSDVAFTMIGNYAGIPCGATTPLIGIGRYVETIYEVGCHGVSCEESDLFGAAEDAARQADATVLVVGLDQSVEREGKDRIGLLLPGQQQELVSRVSKASKGPVVLLLMAGGPIDVTFAKNDPKIGAILWVGFPGQAGGTAIADVLFGKINPGGKLTMTWYPQDYVEKVPMTDMAMRPDPSRSYPGRTYRFYKGPVVFPFGHGLSYTTFAYNLVHAPTTISVPIVTLRLFGLQNSTIAQNAIRVSHTSCDALKLAVHVDVMNTGDMDGAHTVLVFSTPPAGKWAPTKQLVGFEKVHLVAGGRQTVKVEVDMCKYLSIVDKFGTRRIPMDKQILHIGDIKHTFYVQADMGNVHDS